MHWAIECVHPQRIHSRLGSAHTQHVSTHMNSFCVPNDVVQRKPGRYYIEPHSSIAPAAPHSDVDGCDGAGTRIFSSRWCAPLCVVLTACSHAFGRQCCRTLATVAQFITPFLCLFCVCPPVLAAHVRNVPLRTCVVGDILLRVRAQ